MTEGRALRLPPWISLYKHLWKEWWPRLYNSSRCILIRYQCMRWWSLARTMCFKIYLSSLKPYPSPPRDTWPPSLAPLGPITHFHPVTEEHYCCHLLNWAPQGQGELPNLFHPASAWCGASLIICFERMDAQYLSYIKIDFWQTRGLTCKHIHYSTTQWGGSQTLLPTSIT